MSAARPWANPTLAAFGGRVERATATLFAARAAPFVVFALFILLLSYDVLPDNGVLTYADGAYVWPDGGFDFVSTWNASGTGVPFIAQSFATFQYLPNALTAFLFYTLPHGDAWQSYVLYHGSLYACMLIMYFLARRMSGGVAFAYFAGTFLIFNNFILEQLIVWPVTYFYCLAGLLAQLYVLWRIHEDGATMGRISASILISALAHHPFLFIVHFTVQAIFAGFLLMRHRVRWHHAAWILAGGLAVQAYWFVPFIYNLMHASVAETHRASGESAYFGYTQTITYRTLFNLINYPMALDPRISGLVHNFGQTAFDYLVVALIAVALVAVLRRGSSRAAEMVFLLFVYLFFFNLALGPNSQLTGPAWKWAYLHVPGFGFFRSFNRFHLASLLALLMLGALLYGSIRSRFKARAMVLLIALNLAAYGVFFSGTFNGMITAARVPDDYYRAKRAFFSANDGKTILSLPHIPYETYIWSVNPRNDVINPAMYFLFYFMNAPVITNQYANTLDQQRPEYKPVLEYHQNAHGVAPEDYELIRRLGVTHVMVHKDRLDTTRRTDRVVPWREYWQDLARDPRYVMREDNEYFAIFELKDPLLMVSGPSVSFKGITQTKYELLVRNLRVPTDIRFGQGFHQEWKLYPSAQPWESIPGTGLTKNRFYPTDIRRIAEDPVLDESRHHVVDHFANAWTLDPAELRRVLPAQSWRENADGSIDVRLQLYFRPQAFLMLGIACSLLVILACAAGLVGSIRRHAHG